MPFFTAIMIAYLDSTMHVATFIGISSAFHRHFMGKVKAVELAVEFESHEATLERFQREWLEIVESKGTKKS